MTERKGEFVEFPEINPLSEKSSLDLYEEIFEKEIQFRGVDHETSYCSVPMTSGGANRYVKRMAQMKENGEPIAANLSDKKLQGIRLNKLIAGKIISHLSDLPSVQDTRITFPMDFEGLPGFKEYDYLLYWTSFMTGITPQEARVFQQHLQQSDLDRDTFNNFGSDQAKRLEQYAKFTRVFQEYVELESVDIHSRAVRGIYLLPDHRESIGCWLERSVGQIAGIPLHELHFNKAHPESSIFNSVGFKILENEFGFELPTVDEPDGRLIYALPYVE